MNESAQRAYAYGEIPTWQFSDKIRKAREVAGLGQKAFAERVGITASTLAAYETGRSHPRWKDGPTLAKSIQLLTGIPHEWFLVEDEPQPSGPRNGEGWAPWGSNPRPTDYRGYVSDMSAHRAKRVMSVFKMDTVPNIVARDKDARDPKLGDVALELTSYGHVS